MKREYFLLCILSLFCVYLPTFASYTEACETFPKTLSFGTRGEEVRSLQKFLNTYGYPVAITGPGSAGEETLYYGKATEMAVKVFQGKYADEVLYSLGITSPTGVFGERSRTKAHSLSCSNNTEQSKNTEDVSSTEKQFLELKEAINQIKERVRAEEATVLSDVLKSKSSIPSSVLNPTKPPKILSASPATGNIGTRITISGENFGKINTIYTTTQKLENIESRDAKTLEFTISAEQNMLTREGKITTDLPFYVLIETDGVFSESYKIVLQ